MLKLRTSCRPIWGILSMITTNDQKPIAQIFDVNRLDAKYRELLKLRERVRIAESRDQPSAVLKATANGSRTGVSRRSRFTTRHLTH